MSFFNYASSATSVVTGDAFCDDSNWIPTTASGKQVSPNRLRGQITRYIASSVEKGGKTRWIRDVLGVNGNSFNKFMKGNYKDQWSACQNGTYWAAARFFARQKLEAKANPAATKKRKRAATASSASKKTESLKLQLALMTLMTNDPRCASGIEIYEHCDTVRSQLAALISSGRLNQTSTLKLMTAGNTSFKSFSILKGKGAGASNKSYREGYRLLEALRIHDGKVKSQRRVDNEARWRDVGGYSLRHDDGQRLYFPGQRQDPRDYNIDWCKEGRNIKRYGVAECPVGAALIPDPHGFNAKRRVWK